MRLFTTIIAALLLCASCGNDKTDKETPDTTPATPQVTTPKPVKTPAKPTTDDHPELQTQLNEVRSLEKQARIREAIVMCRKLHNKYKSSTDRQVISVILARLQRTKEATLNLSVAIDNLESPSKRARNIARQKLLDAGETGAILLRKAAREESGKVFEECVALLQSTKDKELTAILVNRLIKGKDDVPTAKRIVELVNQSLANMDAELLKKLCDAASSDDKKKRSITLDLLTAIVALAADQDQPAEKMDPRLPRTLYKLATTIKGTKSKRKAIGSLLLFLKKCCNDKADVFNELTGSPDAHTFVTTYLEKRISSKKESTRRWAIEQACMLEMYVAGLHGYVYKSLNKWEEKDIWFQRLDTCLDLPTSAKLKKPGPFNDNMSIRWDSILVVPKTGPYTFSADKDPGTSYAIRINGKEVAGAIELKQGVHEFRLDMWHTTGTCTFQLFWTGPDITRKIISGEHFLTRPFEGSAGLWSGMYKMKKK